MKLFISVALFFISTLLFSQQVERDKVIVEIGTGTW